MLRAPGSAHRPDLPLLPPLFRLPAALRPPPSLAVAHRRLHRCCGPVAQVVEYEAQYDGSGTPTTNSGCRLSSTLNKTTCTVSFTVAEKMEQPVYLYYQLENFYQNHRRYVQSRSDAQLRGEIKSGSALDDCRPLTDGPGATTRNPCGLIAGSFFNGSRRSWGALEGVVANRPLPPPHLPPPSQTPLCSAPRA